MENLHIFSNMIHVSSDSLQRHGTYMLVVRVSFVEIQQLRCMDVRDLRKVGMQILMGIQMKQSIVDTSLYLGNACDLCLLNSTWYLFVGCEHI